MAVLTLPLGQNLPWYSFTATLDAASYEFELCFNNRADRWMLTLADVTGTALVAGIPLLTGRDLLAPYRHLAVPQGLMCVYDATGSGTQPTLGSFLLDHALYYVEVGT